MFITFLQNCFGHSAYAQFISRARIITKKKDLLHRNEFPVGCSARRQEISDSVSFPNQIAGNQAVTTAANINPSTASSLNRSLELPICL